MAQIIGLPKLSPTMEEGVLVRWVKKEGERVEPGDLVAEVETDKANMDFNLEDEGVLLKLLVDEGATVQLGAPVAILGDEGEDISSLLAEAAAGPPAAAPAQPTAAVPTATPTAPTMSVTQAPSPPPSPAPPQAAGRILASPLAKTLAIELGVDLRTLQGSGPGGRIVERDVKAATGGPGQPGSAHLAVPQTLTAMVPSSQPSFVPATIPDSNDFVDQPLSNLRRTIADRLTAAKRDIPHFYLNRDINAEGLLEFRKRLNNLLGDRGKVSINDLFIKGAALALRRVPDCNVAFLGDRIRQHARVHVGVAVATDRGLLTPVIRDADLKGIGVIAAEVRDLATRAKDRAIKAHEIEGSTMTISNLGMFGIDNFSAIINPPEAILLAIGGLREIATVQDGRITVGKRIAISLSCDHRAVDGAVGAQYLAALADILESPESLAL